MASVSTSENLYKEERLPGKGVGCIARVKIKKGDLVLREAPQLLHPVLSGNPTSEENVKQYRDCVFAFMEMSEEDQKRYMELFDKFEASKAWPSSMQKKYLDWQNILRERPIPNISQEDALKAMAIVETNGFHNGVCLKMSRFNHSCQPNAQYFWNEDTDTRDMRALRKIKQGEEITVSYISIGREQLFGRDERCNYIKDTYHFDCRCKACDMAGEEVESETKLIDDYKEEMLRRQQFQDAANAATNGRDAQAWMWSELECLKKMYQTAKQVKTFNRRYFLWDIVEKAFDVSAQGAMSAAASWNMESAKSSWMKEAKQFADIGLEMAKTLNGPDHSETKAWRERSDDPIKFFLDKFGGATKQIAIA